MEINPDLPKPQGVSRPMRVLLLGLAWGGALIRLFFYMEGAHMGLMGFIALGVFPSGLVARPLRAIGFRSAWVAAPAIVIGWLIYLFLCMYILRTKKTKQFWFAFGILVVFLLANVSGCKQAIISNYPRG